MAFDPTVPDWLEQVEETAIQNKFYKHPELEVLTGIIQHPEILKHYVFPQLLTQSEFNFSQNALKFVEKALEENWTLTELLLEMMQRDVAVRDIVKIITWDLFESLVEAILRKFGWETERNFRFKSSLYRKQRFEIDIVAYDRHRNTVLLIDCKRYKNPSQAPIKKAAELQIERTYQFFEALPDMYDRKGLTWVKSELQTSIYPLITTWKDHQMRYYSVDTKVVPITNIENFFDFVQNINKYVEECFHLIWEL